MSIRVLKTKRYSTYTVESSESKTWNIVCDYNCSYTQSILLKCIDRRQSFCSHVCSIDNGLRNNQKVLQFCDFENIDWEVVLKDHNMASCYLIRKGLSRKAQLSLQMKRYFSKNKSSYKESFPYTIIIETWNAFEEMKFDFSPGVFAAFDSSHFANTPFRQRLEWALEDVNYEFHNEDRRDWIWILKPSVTNKAIDISIIKDWNNLIDALERVPDMREWVLQRY